jgi:thymidylate synthase
MSTIRLTLNQSLEEIIQELENSYKTMSRTEILKMVIAEFYNARFGSNSKTNVQSKKNSQIVNKWIDTKVEPEMAKGEIEEVFGDWWSENKEELRK